MDLKEAIQKEKESQDRQKRLSEIEQKIPKEKAKAETGVSAAKEELAKALIAFELGEVGESSVKAIRAKIQKHQTFIDEIPLLRKGIEARQQEEKRLISEPQGVIRAARELEEAKAEYWRAKEKVREGLETFHNTANPKTREVFRQQVRDLQAQAEEAQTEEDYFGFVEAEGLRE